MHFPGLRITRASARRFVSFPFALLAAILIFIAPIAHAAAVRGVVTDASGARISGATVALLQDGKIVTTTVSAADGSYEILTGATGRFFLITSAKSFRQLETPGFYAGRLDTVERNLVLEPEWARESIVVTATGTPTPQPQTSSATTVLGPLDVDLRTTLVSDLRLMPSAAVVQIGQRGAQASLFIRGGDSDSNKVLIDGVAAGDLGGRFDFGNLPTTAVESAEVYRGADSSLYGAGAESGVVSLTTPRGTTSFPSFFLRADGGNFNTQHEEASIAGTHNKLDYLGAFSWLQTSNALPNDEHHLAASAGNLGWQINSTTQIRGTAHYNVAATGVPNAWDFYHVADQATQKDQDIYVSGSIDNQTTASFHNVVRYGLTRKREEYTQWQPEGICMPAGSCGAPGTAPTYTGGNYFGLPVTITGANGTSASGQALLDYSYANGSIYPSGDQLVSNRDQVVYQGDYRFTPHVTGLIGFHYEDERGAENFPAYSFSEATERRNYDYIAAVHGDFKDRFFYTLGGSLEHYSLFGVQTTPRAGVSFYALRPRTGVFSGTRILFNYGDAVREPALPDQFGSLYQFLVTNGYQSTAQQLHIGPLAAPFARMYDGGAEQAFLSERILLRVRYFHNEFGKQIEYVGGHLLPNLLPNLTPDQQQQLIAALGFYYTDDYPLTVNTQAFRAQGIESTLEGGIGRDIFLRGGYTWLDAVVQRSFDSDNEALAGGYEPTYNGIPIGAISPLVGARPFRRPPHTGFITGTYSHRQITAILNMAFASRSDDSTYLEYADATGGNSLLLPNRNLDYGYAKIDWGFSYQWKPWLGFYGITENLTSSQHIGPIGYPSLPFNVRSGIRIQWGKGADK
ncbi:MAG TPA: TonB-dependent receptor plug domain-containing protein [Terracidiphilus sp.]|jgi:iron complex outermembrane receptor protein/vitamin B12 transporter|nr:TonB-dependent receptor plug domain-containing protein [Terracidiphilus sp.]